MNTLLRKPSANTAENVIDKFNIKELIEFERFCRDNAQWEEMKKCFAENSTVAISWFKGSGHEFVTASSKMATYAPHKLFDTLVWLNKDKAVAITMATIQIRMEIEGHLLELQSDVKLLYKTQKINNVWAIISMEGIYEKDSLLPVSPADGIKIPKEEIAKFRPSYANMSYALSKSGYPIDVNLPGIDKPETVSKLYQESEDWLNS
ncbi:nuclear transport factor 2 family protein [Flavobacterium johnsoniae]|uniref:Bile acid 7-alpha dehydratase n=1 Tax=Flavobacterium johnsoniae TaxID=986 RepID=A0A1J7BVI2_FLAJO|nr:nuclear transport factor 2 family protein [Flavobacterium johnsoniae]OIV42605.1 bile acid 7-alpha dehydratase [Flavobacterium johnsoniae]